jgi:hypothetical protein
MEMNATEQLVSVTVFHNISRDASFGLNSVWRSGDVAPEGVRAYQNEKTGKWSWKSHAEVPAERHELVRVFEYAADPEDVENDKVLEGAFAEFNIGSGPVAQRYRANRLRSLSVGDVVKVGDQYWSVESAGWTERQESEVWVLPALLARYAVRQRYDFGRDEELSVTVPLANGACQPVSDSPAGKQSDCERLGLSPDCETCSHGNSHV